MEDLAAPLLPIKGLGEYRVYDGYVLHFRGKYTVIPLPRQGAVIHTYIRLSFGEGGDTDGARLLKQHLSITAYRLPAKENKLLFFVSVCSKQTELCRFRFRLQQTKRKRKSPF
jgi:hypothetical protein